MWAERGGCAAAPAVACFAAQLTFAKSEERDQVGCRHERIGDEAAVAQRERRDELRAELADEERRPRR